MSINYGTIYGAGNSQPSLWEARRTNLFTDASAVYLPGEAVERTPIPIDTMFINRVDRTCSIYVGAGKRTLIGEFYPHTKMVIQMPSNVTEYTVVWEGTDFAAFADSEQVGTPILEIWLSSSPIFHAASYDPGPRISDAYQPNAPNYNRTTIVIADVPLASPTVAAIPFLNDSRPGNFGGFTGAGNFTYRLIPTDMAGAVGIVSKYDANDNEAYPGTARAGFRTYSATTAAQYSATFSGRRALFSLWNNASDRTARLRSLDLQIIRQSAATPITFTLEKMSSESTGGASITAQQHAETLNWPVSASALVTRNAPTALGASSGAYSTVGINNGITGAVSVINPAPIPTIINVYRDDYPDGVMPIELSRFLSSGVALIATPGANVTLTYVWSATWTEVEQV